MAEDSGVFARMEGQREPDDFQLKGFRSLTNRLGSQLMNLSHVTFWCLCESEQGAA